MCWAMRPQEPTQQLVKMYFEETVLHNIKHLVDVDTKFVAVHVRRGDYTNKNLKELHGALSTYYYTDAWNSVLARSQLLDKTGQTNLVVLVFAASNSIDWCKENLKFPGARAVQFVDPNQSGRGPAADIDLLALSLADYFILANSTFCWWSHFYAECRRRLPKWWSVPYSIQRTKPNRPVFTLPHHWHKTRDKNKPLVYNFIQMDTIVPGTGLLFENMPPITAD